MPVQSGRKTEKPIPQGHKTFPNRDGNIFFIYGHSAEATARSVWTARHIFDFLVHWRLNGLHERWRCGEALRGLTKDGNDALLVLRLRKSLCSVIAGDFDVKYNRRRLLLTLAAFPLQLVSIEELEAGLDKNGIKHAYEKVESQHKEDIERGECFLISVAALLFWCRCTTRFPDPKSTFWNIWSKNVSRQVLGEAVCFKLCTLHSLTNKLVHEKGSTKLEAMQSFISSKKITR